MPRISQFLGITIAMYYDDHPPPHFHVKYGEDDATMDIETMRITDGELPPRVLGLVTEWGVRHRVHMIKKVVEVRPAGGYRLFIRFDDGVQGEIDVQTFVRFDGVFEELRDLAKFAAAFVDLNTVCWPNGADLAPELLYAKVSERPLSV